MPAEIGLELVLKPGALCGQAVEYLTDLIMAGRLRVGDYLPPEPELCRQLGLSRATVREAVRMLEARGLIERRHGVGVVVVNRSHEATVSTLSLLLQRNGSGIRDLLEVRIGLECQAAALAATRAAGDDHEAMAAALAQMARESSTVEEYVDADLDFHLRLAEGSHNRVLAALTVAIRDLMRESIRATYDVNGRTEGRLRDHTRVFEAVVGGDPQAAHEAMLAHLRSTEETLRALGRV